MATRFKYDGLKYDGLPRPSKRPGSTGLEAHRTSARRTFWMVGVVILLVWAFSLACSIARADERDAVVERLALDIDSAHGLLTARPTQQFLGARSCAASACHGGVDPDPRFRLSRRNEYAYWLDNDPHARGYQTLQNDLSKAILERLSRSTDDNATRAKRLANCFGCHNPQPDRSQQAETYFARDAVSCEICHGPAEQWIGEHVTAAWPQLKQTIASFIDTENITVRAQLCAACHVGSPGREVNHDLIAAGHPALKFELTAYYAMLPKHWRDADERKVNPFLELSLWQAGQVACGEAALALLKWRASRAADEVPGVVWPEFVEYDCYACHHELVHPSWRQTAATEGVPFWMPAWSSWYFSRFKRRAATNLQSLADLMQRGFRPDPIAVIEAANSVQLSTAGIDAETYEPVNWDDATQLYLFLVALEQAQRDIGKAADDELTAAIKRLREQLSFPPGYNSPKGLFEPQGAGATREQVRKSLAEVLDLLKQQGAP